MEAHAEGLEGRPHPTEEGLAAFAQGSVNLKESLAKFVFHRQQFPHSVLLGLHHLKLRERDAIETQCSPKIFVAVENCRGKWRRCLLVHIFLTRLGRIVDLKYSVYWMAFWAGVR
jgi:hypothetical protein